MKNKQVFKGANIFKCIHKCMEIKTFLTCKDSPTMATTSLLLIPFLDRVLLWINNQLTKIIIWEWTWLTISSITSIMAIIIRNLLSIMILLILQLQLHLTILTISLSNLISNGNSSKFRISNLLVETS